MPMLVNWGYKRRYWERKSNLYAAGESRTWGSSTYVNTTGAEQPISARIGSHSVSEQTVTATISGVPRQQQIQHIYNDCVYIVFPLPASNVREALISFTMPAQALTTTIKARRITSAISGSGFPNMSSTNAVTQKTTVSGGTMTLDITGIINDAVSAGAFYGIALTANDTDPWYTRKNDITFSNIVFGGDIGDGIKGMTICINGQQHKAVASQVFVDGVAKKVKSRKIYVNGSWHN